jgi:hypothetical protein
MGDAQSAPLLAWPSTDDVAFNDFPLKSPRSRPSVRWPGAVVALPDGAATRGRSPTLMCVARSLWREIPVAGSPAADRHREGPTPMGELHQESRFLETRSRLVAHSASLSDGKLRRSAGSPDGGLCRAGRRSRGCMPTPCLGKVVGGLATVFGKLGCREAFAVRVHVVQTRSRTDDIVLSDLCRVTLSG